MAEWLLQFQASMRVYKDSDWAFNGLRQPYKIKERNPGLLRIDPHLQVLCVEGKCMPSWWPDYESGAKGNINHLKRPIDDWRNAAYCYHWPYPTPPEFQNY